MLRFKPNSKVERTGIEPVTSGLQIHAVRPFHDLRHSSLTDGAAAGEQPIALMARAGHSSMATTKGYLHLAGVVFREEADAHKRRLLTSAY